MCKVQKIVGFVNQPHKQRIETFSLNNGIAQILGENDKARNKYCNIK